MTVTASIEEFLHSLAEERELQLSEEPVQVNAVSYTHLDVYKRQVVEGSSRTEERTKTRIAFSTLRHEEVDSGLQSVSSAVVYTVDKNGLYGPVNNNPITEVDSRTAKDMIAVLETVSKEKLPE